MIYKIRLILDTVEDVLREIVISYNDTLEDLHNAITDAYGFLWYRNGIFLPY